MIKKIKLNIGYIVTVTLTLFILSCDEDTPTASPNIEDTLYYCLSMEHTVEGGSIDYADNNSNDQRVISVSLKSSVDAECAESLTPVSDASLTFNWSFDNESASQGSAAPHLQTIPANNESAIDIYQNESTTTNQNGEISFYWIDEGQEGCVYFYCDFTDGSDDVWSLEIPEDNCDNSSTTNSNPFEVVAIEITYENIEYFVLDLSPDILIFNDLPSSVDSTESDNQLTIKATVKDVAGVGLDYIPVQFSNLTPAFGVLTNGTVFTNENGIAENLLIDIDTDPISDDALYANIKISANITGGDYNETITDSVLLVPRSLNNIWQVNNLDAYWLQELNLINNVNISFQDTIYAQVLGDTGPIEGVPINFNLNTNDIGYIDDNIVYSNASGEAQTVFHITPGDLDDATDDNGEIDVSVEVVVTEDSDDEADDGIYIILNRTYVVSGSANIEFDVIDFNYYPSSPEYIPTYAFPTDNPGLYMGVQEPLPMIVKNSAGVRIEGVPVQYEIFHSSIRSNGSLSTAIDYSCCLVGQDSTVTDSLIDWDMNGTATEDENRGIAHVLYDNGIVGSSDSVRAFIVNPQNQTEILHEERIKITTYYIDELVDSLKMFAVPEIININTTDSTYCDTIYTVAKNQSGVALKDIPVYFEVAQQDLSYGILTRSYAITDTVSALPFFAAKTEFCTYPNINFDNELNNSADVIIRSSVLNTSQGAITDSILVILNEDLPDCPDCEESLTLEASYYELPNTDLEGNDVFISLITATVVDSTENPVPVNTLVQFECLADDQNGELNTQIGSIDPWSYTGADDDEQANGEAEAIFNMGSDVGLATIIATAPQYNLADTIYVSLYSTDAAYVEINQPFPNELELQGGGGVSSTEIEVEVKDGNGNLVSEPFLLRFEILPNAPTGAFLNEQDEDWDVEWVESSNGIATVTLNSGNQPGSIPLRVELYYIDLEIEHNDCGFFNNFTCPDSCSCDDDNDGLSDNYELHGISAAEDIPVTVLTGPPHSGEINFSYVDITPIGGGLYQVPLTVQLEDEWANPVSDSTNVYIWIEGHAPSFNMTLFNGGLYDTADTLKWGEETSTNQINLRDSLLYVLLVDDEDDNGSITQSDIDAYNPNTVNMLPPNLQNWQGTNASTNMLGIPDTDPDACNCYGNELYDQCSDDGGLTTLCIWEVIPTQPGSVVGEAKTGMLGPNNESIPGVAWSNVYYGTSDMFARTVIKALTFDIDGQELVIDSRDNHSGQPLVLPYQPGGEGVTVAPSLVFWDFGTMGQATAEVEPDWVNDISLTDAASGGVSVTVTLTDYYQYGVDNGIVLLSAPGSAVDETYDGPGFATGSTYDWVACNPVDTDGDGFTGTCDGLPDFDNNCSLCVANLGTWLPDQSANGANSGTYDDNQSLCITNSSGQCTWVIHYSEFLTPEQGAGGGGVTTYADFTSTLTATLQNPLITGSAGVDIRLEKNPPPE